MSRAVEGHPIPFKAKLIALGALGLAGPVMIACGAKAENPRNGVSGDSDAIPNATQTLLPSEQQLTPTLEPKPTATEVAVPEITREQLQKAVNEALPYISDQNDALSIVQFVSDGIAGIDIAKEGNVPVDNPVSFFGNAFQRLFKYYCQTPDNTELKEATRLDRDFAIQYINSMQQEGKLDMDADEAFTDHFFTLPTGCEL